jgi:hypothetical protein
MAPLSGYAGVRPVNDIGQWVDLPAQVPAPVTRAAITC